MTLNFTFFRRIRHILRPAACAGLSFIYFLTNVLCLYADQSSPRLKHSGASFWKERQQAVQKMKQESDLLGTLANLNVGNGLKPFPTKQPVSHLNQEQYQLLAQLPQVTKLDLASSNNAPTNIPSFSKGGLGRIMNNPPSSPFRKGVSSGLTTTPNKLGNYNKHNSVSESWLSAILPYGDIRDVYISHKPNSPLIIHIQDIHQVEEAQKNIANVLNVVAQFTRGELAESIERRSKHVTAKTPDKLVVSLPNPSGNYNEHNDAKNSVVIGVEGASGQFNLNPYRDYFGTPEIAKAIAGYLLKEGYIGGPEFAGLTAPEPPLLWGVENKQLYDSNVQAFKDSLKYKPQVDVLLSQLKATAEGLKERIYSKGLKEFDSHFNAYKNDKEKLGAYVRYLFSTLTSISTYPYPNLNLFIQALSYEEHLDFNKVDKERQELVTLMVKQLAEEQLDYMLKQSLAYRMGSMSYSGYYQFLRKFCHANKISFDSFRQLKSYVTYVQIAERINRNKLLDELTALEESILNSLARTPEQKRLVTASRHLLLLEKLTSHQMTPQDWTYYEKNKESILQSLSFPQSVSGNPAPLTIQSLLTPFEDFCRIATQRNNALVSNLLTSTYVLIAGGFHSDGLTQILKAKNISYVVVTPKITEIPKDTKYLDVFAHDPTPLEKLFTGEVISLSPELVLGNGIGSSSRPEIAHGLLSDLALVLQMKMKEVELLKGSLNEKDQEQTKTAIVRELQEKASGFSKEVTLAGKVTIKDVKWSPGHYIANSMAK